MRRESAEGGQKRVSHERLERLALCNPYTCFGYTLLLKESKRRNNVMHTLSHVVFESIRVQAGAACLASHNRVGGPPAC